jgi:hypothetical protein
LQTCTAQSDCGSTSYCKITSGTSGTCTAKNTNGTVATQGFECTSGIVADGVCCDQACTGCKACSGSPLTGGAAGQCLNILAGKVAHNACTNSGTACGLDGTCDGLNACRSTPGPGQSCDDPSNLCNTGKTCQGGVCTGGTTKTCPPPTQKCRNTGVCDPATGNCNYAVSADSTTCDDGNSCTQFDACLSGVCTGSQILCNSPPPCKLATTCSMGGCSYTQAASDGSMDRTCPGATPYCSGGSCVQCTTDTQCSGTTPSCDPNSHKCVCRRKSAGNVLTNPGFDGSLAGWTGPDVTLDTDSEGCASSNSVYAANVEEEPLQCFPASSNTFYYFGGRFKGGSPGGFFRIYFFDSPGCTGNTVGSTFDFTYPLGSTDWHLEYQSFMTPVGTASARVGGFILGGWVDELYVNASYNQF